MDESRSQLSLVLIALMKGVTEREADPVLWQALLKHEGPVRDHIALLGLDLHVDEAEGFAYLRQRPPVEGEVELPRLVARRQLSFPVSLLLALIRKSLVEFEAISGGSRLILSREAIVDMLRLFLGDTANEARLMDRIDGHIRRVVELGFLRPLRGHADQFEVSRILKAFVDAQWLGGFNDRLQEYRRHAGDLAADASPASRRD